MFECKDYYYWGSKPTTLCCINLVCLVHGYVNVSKMVKYLSFYLLVVLLLILNIGIWEPFDFEHMPMLFELSFYWLMTNEFLDEPCKYFVFYNSHENFQKIKLIHSY